MSSVSFQKPHEWVEWSSVVCRPVHLLLSITITIIITTIITIIIIICIISTADLCI